MTRLATGWSCAEQHGGQGSPPKPTTQEEQAAQKRREQRHRPRQAPALCLGVEIVVDAEEGAVEAQAEHDLGERREEQQQRQDAVVGGER